MEYLEAKWNEPIFSRLVFDIYEELPAHGGELRSVAKQVCQSHMGMLLAKEEFKEMVLEVPELALDLLKAVVV